MDTYEHLKSPSETLAARNKGHHLMMIAQTSIIAIVGAGIAISTALILIERACHGTGF